MYQRKVNGYTYDYAGDDPEAPKPQEPAKPKEISLSDITTVSANAETVQGGFAALDAALSVINSNVKANNVQASDIQGVLSALTELEKSTQRMTADVETNIRTKLDVTKDAISADVKDNADTVLADLDNVNSRINDLTSKYETQVSYIRQILTSVSAFPSEIEKVFYQCSLVSTELSKLREDLRQITQAMRDDITASLIAESEHIRADISEKTEATVKHIDEVHEREAVKADKRADYLFTMTAGVLALKALGDICNAIFKKEK